MLTAVYSTKGGVGTTTVAALLAVASAGRAHPTTLVDLCGDAAAVLGVDDDEQPGYADWSRQPRPEPSAVDRIAVRPTPDLAVVARGVGGFGDTQVATAAALASRAGRVVADIGVVRGSSLHGDAAGAPDPSQVDRHRQALLAHAVQRVLVVRLCYLSLRSARHREGDEGGVAPTGVIVVGERGRALARCDVEAVIDAPVIAEIAVDASVARAVDAGLLSSRPPRQLVRSLARWFDDVAS